MNGQKRCRIVLLGLIAVMAVPRGNAATNYYYDPGRTSGASWHDANAWSTNSSSGPFDQAWVDGNVAHFNFTGIKIASLASTTAQVAGLVNGTANAAWIGSANPVDLTFTGAATIAGGSGGFQLRGSVTAVGPFTLTGGRLDMVGTAGLRGTMTVQGGVVWPQASTLTTNSHFALTGGNVILEQNDTYPTIGRVNVASSDFVVGRFSGNPVAATISSLSGTGGRVISRQVGTAGDGIINDLIVNQTSNRTYSGTMAGVSDAFQGFTYLTLTKSGSGDLTLAGTVNLRQGTTVDGGRLYINGASVKNFYNLTGGAGSDAITVAAGGGLGGTATITVLGGTYVTVAEGGALVAGIAGAAGRTIYAFESGQGGVLDCTGATSSNKWLHFDLGSTATAGTTYDQIQVTGGTLDIGSGLLGLGDFSFTELPGLEAGTYVLFNNAALSGSLGTAVSGQIVPRWDGTLRISGNNIVLDVVPQPTGTAVTVR